MSHGFVGQLVSDIDGLVTYAIVAAVGAGVGGTPPTKTLVVGGRPFAEEAILSGKQNLSGLLLLLFISGIGL